MVKFSPLGRQKLEEELKKLHEGVSSVEYVLRNLRPIIRKVIIAITAGEGVHPEVIRMQLSVFVKAPHLPPPIHLIAAMKVCRQTAKLLRTFKIYLSKY